jgi:hypothetical protein
MSKLPNAPLVEVIFEIKWDILNRADVVDFQYLHGDLYSQLKEKYSFRESLVPPEVPVDVMKGIPVFRFRPQKNSHPLVQIGPGLLTFNALDSQYYWEEFREESNRLIDILDDIYPKFNDLNVSPMLTYIDFFEFDFVSPNAGKLFIIDFGIYFGILFTLSLVQLGSIAFGKWNLVKTIGVLVGFQALLYFYARFIGAFKGGFEELRPAFFLDGIPDDIILIQLSLLVFMVITLLVCWTATFLKLKEREV